MIQLNNRNKYNMTEKDMENYIRSTDKSAVERKLREMGMTDVADKLRRTDNEQILRMLKANPDIINKVNQIMGGKNNGR